MMAVSPENAPPELRRLLAIDPQDAEAMQELALLLQTEGWLADAEQVYDRLLRLAPDHCTALAMRGRLRLLAGDVAAAAAGFRRVLEIDPGFGEAAAGEDRCRRYAELQEATGREDLPRGLAVRGSFRDTSGYAHMTRRFVRGLAARGVAQHLIDVQLSFVPLFAREARAPDLEAMARTPVRARAMLNFTIPSMVEPAPGLTPLTFTMFEARTVPASWARYAAGRLPLLITPSLSSRDAWIAVGFPAERVALCPLGVEAPPPGAVAPTEMLDDAGRRLSQYATRFLNVSDLCDRKNIGALLRVWLRATRRGDDAALVLKLGKGREGERELATRYLHRTAADIGKTLSDGAPVFLAQGVLGDDQMAGLFAACTHYWSMSHGEGWDLPMTQAGGLGLSLIAPRHSAYETYLNDDVATLLPSRLVPALPPYAGMEWWSPDEDAAVAAVAAAVAGAPRRSARAHLAANFSWDQASDRLLAVLRDVGAL
jgi:glycosyltransferase involved in cell wall biosynthesis